MLICYHLLREPEVSIALLHRTQLGTAEGSTPLLKKDIWFCSYSTACTVATTSDQKPDFWLLSVQESKWPTISHFGCVKYRFINQTTKITTIFWDDFWVVPLGWFLRSAKKGRFFFKRSNRCRFSAKDNWDTKGRNTPCAKKNVTAGWNSEINLEILGVLFLSVLINNWMFC